MVPHTPFFHVQQMMVKLNCTKRLTISPNNIPPGLTLLTSSLFAVDCSRPGFSHLFSSWLLNLILFFLSSLFWWRLPMQIKGKRCFAYIFLEKYLHPFLTARKFAGKKSSIHYRFISDSMYCLGVVDAHPCKHGGTHSYTRLSSLTRHINETRVL